MSDELTASSRSVDFIVVGAGSAGCALANRLSASGQHEVLLLEAGGIDWSPYIHIPAAIIRAIGNPALDWAHQAEPDVSRNNRVDLWPAGKVLGGSSSINGMLWVRGHREDYDAWANAGCTGWDFQSLLPLFKRCESYAGGDPQIRGREGEVQVSPLRSTHPLAHVFVEAARQHGVALNDDYNGEDQEGVAYSQVTQSWGRRFSAAKAFLKPARNRRNLRIEVRATMHRLLIDDGRCIGVEFEQNGVLHRVRARREVALSAGSLGTPKLLMQSGIGPSQSLQSHDIRPLVDAPEVGQNLLEHPEGMVGIDVNIPTYNTEINSWRIALHMVNWLFRGRGPATSPYPHAVAFIRSSPDEPRPDIQVQLGPYAFTFSEEGVLPYEKPAISAAVNIAHPNNAGRISLTGKQAADPIRIEHGLLRSDEDMARLILGCRKVREIFASPAFNATRVAERLPGPDVHTDDEWAEYLRQTAFLGYHPVGTCRMGDDANSVVDPELRVRGIEGLRVADASIMPTLINANTQATAVVIGEKASDLLLAAAESGQT